MPTPRKIKRIPAQRVPFSCSPKNNFAPNAPATYASDVAGTTKLTGKHDSISRNEKKDAAINTTASQSQPTRSERRTNDRIARGWKSWTSPSSFMACVRQISPPVPVTTTKRRMNAVRMSGRPSRNGSLRSRAVRRAVHQHDAKNDQNDSHPAGRGNLFVQKQVREQRDQRVGNRGKRHHETVVGPRKHEHVAHHETEHQRDPRPNRSARQHARPSRRQGRKVRNVQVPRVLHPFAQKRVPNRAEHDEQEKQHVGFGFVSLFGSHCGS